jgi:chitodextrinase
LRKPVVFACLLLLVLPGAAAAHGGGLNGTLVEVHGHRVDGKQVDTSFALRSSGGTLPLADRQPERLIGQRVHLDDADTQTPGLQGKVAAAGEQTLAAAVAPGPRSLLVILVTTPEQPTPLTTADGARAAVFTGAASTNAFYKQQSAGATSFVGRMRADGDVAGPLAIDVSLEGCDVYEIASAADAAAVAAGFAVSAYDHVLYALPQTDECDFGGLGELPGRRTWMNGTLLAPFVTHELGHNLGAHHASSLRCTDAGGAIVPLAASCASTEYGDPFDTMGLTGRLMSSWHRLQIGQLPAGQSVRLKASQTVSIVSSDDFTSPGTRVVIVPRKVGGMPVSTSLALELRSPLAPFDAFPAGDPVTTGVSVRVVPNPTVATQSQLLDARPETLGLGDAPLPVGETLRDERFGISIRVSSVAAGVATVSVTMPPLVDDVAPAAPPNVRLSGDTAGAAVRWEAGTDDEGVDHYDVERDGQLIGTTPGLAFDDAGVTSLLTPSYRVITVDTSGNRGASPPVSTTLADVTPPSGVPGVALRARGADVTATWSPALDNRAIGAYRVFRNGVFVRAVLGFSFTERAPKGQHTYAITAVDTAGNVGPPASATMPSATTGSSISRPRIVLLRRTHKGRLVTMRFIAKGATGLRVYRGARRLARTSGDRISVTTAVPRRGRRARLEVVASSWAGDRVKHFTIR